MSNDKKKKSLFSSRKFRHGGFSVMMIAAVIVIVALLNVVVSTLDSMWGLSYDLSSNKLYTISAQSKKVVSQVDQDVKIYALMQSGSESSTVENLLENYRKLAPDYIDVTVIDPVQNPTFANQFTSEALSMNSVIVTNGDGSRYRVIDQYDMYEFGYTSNYQSYVKSFIGEQKLTNAISFVTAEQVANAYFLTGHQVHLDRHIPVSIDALQRAGIILVIGERDEIVALLAQMCGNNRGILTAIGADGMQMQIAHQRNLAHQIALDCVNRQADFLLGTLVDHDIILLLAHERIGKAQAAISAGRQPELGALAGRFIQIIDARSIEREQKRRMRCNDELAMVKPGRISNELCKITLQRSREAILRFI